MKCSLGIYNFLEQISSLSHSIAFFYTFFFFFFHIRDQYVFFYIFTLITEEGFLISPCNSLVLCIQMGISLFPPLPFTSLLFSAICKVSSGNHFAFLYFFFLGTVLITMSQTSDHSATLSIRSNPLSLFAKFINLENWKWNTFWQKPELNKY